MNIYSGILVFSVLWWVILFMVLPVGVRMVSQPKPGHATSAPENPRIFFKLMMTTLITIPFFFLIKWMIEHNFFSN